MSCSCFENIFFFPISTILSMIRNYLNSWTKHQWFNEMESEVIDQFIKKDVPKNSERILTPIGLSDKKSSIVIVGGGFAGLYSALNLTSRIDSDKFDIYLIDPKPRFTFLPLLFEYTVGSARAAEVAPKYKEILDGTKIKFIQGNAYHIDFQNNICMVELYSESTEKLIQPIKFGKMILSPGNQPKIDLIAGAKEHSIPFYSLENACILKKQLKQLSCEKKHFQVTIIGGNYSSIELATNLAHTFHQQISVQIVNRGKSILTYAMEYNRNSAEKALNTLGISIRHHTTVREITEEGCLLADLLTKEETFFQSDLVIFTAGGEPSALVKDLDLLKDQSSQRILVKNTLQTMQYPNIFAIGDCSLIEGQPYPATAQVAFQQSVVVTTNLLQLIKIELTGQPNKPGAMTEFKYLSLGEMISLGDFNASVSFLNGWIGLRGPFASIGRRLLYIYRMPTWSQSFYAALVAIKSSGIKLIRSSLPSAPYSNPLH